MEELDSLEERRVEAYLAPLRMLTPVAARPTPAKRARSLRTPAALVAAVLGLAVVGVAVARETFAGHATPDRVPISLPGRVTCASLVGMDAQRAAALLERRANRVSWRLTRYVDPTQNSGVVGYASRVASPPPGTIVEDVAVDDGGLVVFVRQGGDAHAPPLAVSRC
jgi:hypothetical protein